MSHHYSGPDFGFPHGDARLDFTDLYAFPKPGDSGKSILIMNVHPSASENPSGPTGGARPAQAVILVEERDAYLTGEPADDERFVAAFAHALEHTGGYSPADARLVAGTLLPDVLSYDPTRPASFPDNGRTLTDDAFDWFIRILTNGKVTEDKVGPHRDLIPEFPYVGPPHRA